MIKTSGSPEVFAILKTKPTVRQISEFVEKVRKIKNLLFRHFIYVKLRIAVEVCQNLPLPAKAHKNCAKNTNFFCPLLDISVSGTPIIQDGKLVGAVTHVLVNDPTTGYGIFIENMLDAVA